MTFNNNIIIYWKNDKVNTKIQSSITKNKKTFYKVFLMVPKAGLEPAHSVSCVRF